MDLKAGISWIKSHPWEAGGAIFLVGIVGFFALGSGKGSSSGGSTNLSSYLQAETAQNASDNALQAMQAQLAAATTQAHIAGETQVAVNNTWASENLATTEANNAASSQNSLIDYFGKLANNLGLVLTNTKSSSSSASGGGGFSIPGIFGISAQGASSNSSGSSTQSYVVNSQQAAAEHELEQIANSQFHLGN